MSEAWMLMLFVSHLDARNTPQKCFNSNVSSNIVFKRITEQ